GCVAAMAGWLRRADARSGHVEPRICAADRGRWRALVRGEVWRRADPVGGRMTTLRLVRDDHDWLLDLGREQGESRIMTPLHESAQKLVNQFRPPIADALTLPWLEARDAVRFMPGKVSV